MSLRSFACVVLALTALEGSADQTPPGYAVQTGYEGYLLPAPQDAITSPSFFAPMVTSVVSFVWRTVGSLLLGAVFTLGLCTFTPFCTVTLRGLSRETMRSYLNPDSLSELVADAVDAYRKMQNAKTLDR